MLKNNIIWWAAGVGMALRMMASIGVLNALGALPKKASGYDALAPVVTVVAMLGTSPAWAQTAIDQPSEDGIILLLAALGPALVGLSVFWLQRLWPRIHPKLVIVPAIRRRWATGTRNFARAQIATILVPLVMEVFDRGRANGGNVLIVGSDGAYLVGKKKRKLQDAIVDWTNRGMTVRYLLVEPTEDALAELNELRQRLKCGGSLEVLPLRNMPVGVESMHGLVDLLRSVHPTLIDFTNDDGDQKKTMWIESRHLPGDFYSSGNRWVAPEAMGEPAGPDETWDDVFSKWSDRLASLCACVQPCQAIVR